MAFLSQTKFTKDLVSKFGLRESKLVSTPMSTSDKITKDFEGAGVDSPYYRSIIGSFLYFTASIPDNSFSVGVCARYQATPKESHFKACKRIIRYIHRTTEFELWYPFDTTSKITGYLDVDWAGDVEDRKSTTRGCFYICNSFISWHNRKQNFISLSTAKAEYIATGSGCTQHLWIKQMLKDYELEQDTMSLFVDNKSTIEISKNLIQYSMTKHIDIRHHFIHQLVEEKVMSFQTVWVSSECYRIVHHLGKPI